MADPKLPMMMAAQYSDLPIPGTFVPVPPRPKTLDEAMRGISQELSQKAISGASSVAEALMAPGNALNGEYNYVEVQPSGYVNPFNTGLVDAANNMAGVVSLSSAPMPRPMNSLGMGGTNYRRPLQNEVPTLYREMNAERANELLEGRLQTPWGQAHLYWSDVPELAKGQAENIGIRMKMRTEGVEGKTDLSSKPGLQFVNAMKGGREYVTTGGVDFNKVDEITVSPLINDYGSVDDRRLLLQLRALVDAGKFRASSPDGFVTVYERVK